jgi:hypothetical protein
MRPFIPMLVNLGTAFLLLAAAFLRRLDGGRVRRLVFSALLLLNAALLAAYVFGEDTYRDNGTSRWEAYRSPGGALGGMFVASIATLCLSAALLAFAGLSSHRRLFRWSALAGALCSLLLVTPTLAGFSLN